MDNQIIDINKYDSPRLIGYLTYKQFAKKYKIPLMRYYINNQGNKQYIYKSMQQLSCEIYLYETDHPEITNGLYYFD